MSNPYPTPHITATPDDFAKTVLMPGDPKRSEFIAANFLENARLINDVRGVKGYTGLYKGNKISVMASGMGMPSMGIYSYELFNFFGVENIIRIGSAGSYQGQVKVRDLVIAQGACTDSNYINRFHLPGSFAPIADYHLINAFSEQAKVKGAPYHVGNVISSDVFYGDDAGLPEALNAVQAWAKMGVMAVEMEAAALYINAARSGKKALAVCTISDHLITGENTTAEERQTSFTVMIELALETAITL